MFIKISENTCVTLNNTKKINIKYNTIKLYSNKNYYI